MKNKNNKKSHKDLNILGIGIDSKSEARVLKEVSARVKEFNKKKTYRKITIFTPNPEHLLMANKDRRYKKVLGIADYMIPDGIGLIHAAKFFSLPTPKNKILKAIAAFGQGIIVGLSTWCNRSWLESDIRQIKGRELFLKLIKLANKNKWRVYFLGGENKELAGETAWRIQKKYKSVKIKYRAGPMLNNNARPVSKRDSQIETDTIKDINDFKPHLLFVNFGAPKQEKWVSRWKSKLNIGGVMVVGRTFEWIAGTSRIAPEWMSDLQLEWLWRLLTGSTTPKRIFSAAVVFPWKVYVSKVI